MFPAVSPRHPQDVSDPDGPEQQAHIQGVHRGQQLSVMWRVRVFGGIRQRFEKVAGNKNQQGILRILGILLVLKAAFRNVDSPGTCFGAKAKVTQQWLIWMF